VTPIETSHTDHCIHLSVVVADAFDGAVRLLTDAQRFGFRIRAFHLDAMEDKGATIRIALGVSPETDPNDLRSRLARHPTVISLEAA
jgi:hypothetical protein